MTTSIVTSNPLGAKVLKFMPFNGTEGDILSGSPFNLGAGTIINDPTDGSYLSGAQNGSVAATIQLDLTGHQVLTLGFRAKGINAHKVFEHGNAQATNVGMYGAFSARGPLNAEGFCVTANHDSGYDGTYWNTPSNYDDNQWHYHVVVLDFRGGATPVGQWYVDGVQMTYNGTGFGANPNSFYSGLLYLLPEGAGGAVQNLAVFDGELSQDEVTSLSANPKQLTEMPTTPATAINGTTLPANLGIGQVSAPVSLTLNGTVTNPVVVTPSGAGLTFSPSSVTLTSDNRTGSFTISGSTPGLKTITYSNNAGLANPADLHITLAASILYVVTTQAEAAAAAAAASTFDCVVNKMKVQVQIDNDLTLTGVTFYAKSASDDYFIEIMPTPGKGHGALDNSGPLNYGTAGIELTLASDHALVLESGVRLNGFRMNVTATNGLLVQGGGAGISPRVEHNKIKANAWAAINSNAYEQFELYDNLILRETPSGGALVNGNWSIDVQRNTFVLMPGGTADNAHTGGWAATYDANGAFMINNAYYNFSAPASGSFFGGNNYSNMGGGNLITVDTNNAMFVNAANDFRAGAALLGKGDGSSISKNDVRGNNRGLVPDVGSGQQVAADPLVVPTIQSQSFSNGTLTISGTYTGHATGAEVFCDPLFWSYGVPRQGPVNVTFDDTAKTFTATIANMPRAAYRRPQLTMLNNGGRGPVATGGSSIDNYLPPVANPQPLPTILQANNWQPRPATNYNVKCEHRRPNGQGGFDLIATYGELGDLFAADGRASSQTAPVQSGDEVWVYPARYRKQVFINTYDTNGGANPLTNIKIKGITVNGERPVIYWESTDPSGGQYGYPGNPMYNLTGIVYFLHAGDGVVWDNIDVQWGGGYLAKSLMYVNNAHEGQLTVKNCRIRGAFEQGQNGFLTAHGTKLDVHFENVESGFNGGDGGPPPSGGDSLAHGFYITRHDKKADGTYPLISFRGCQFHNSFRGHLLKCRNPNLLVEGCYFMGAPPSAFNDPAMPDNLRNTQCDVSDASELDMPNGGALTFRNNILTKSWTGHEQGIFLLNWAAESGRNYSPGEFDITGALNIYNNTFVAYTNVSRILNTGTANAPTPWGFCNDGITPDDDRWDHVKNPTTIRDNVYAGFKEIAGGNFWHEQTAQWLTLAEINLPGIDSGVPFSPKLSAGSVGASGVGLPMYAQRAMHGIRTDTNKGAVGTLQANIAPSGYDAQPMMSAQSNMQGELPADGRGVQYPLQYEWPVSVAATTVNSGSTGAPVTPPADPTPTADPTVGITTADTGIMNGKTGTMSGVANLQGDANGTVSLALVSQIGGGTITITGITVSGGAWTTQFTVPKGLWKFVVTATANGKTVTATTGSIRVLGLVGNFTLPA